MTISEVKKYLSSLIRHITFEYNGYSCGVDPITLNSFDMWYGDNVITVDSIDQVINNNFFDGKSLKDIFDDITELEF